MNPTAEGSTVDTLPDAALEDSPAPITTFPHTVTPSAPPAKLHNRDVAWDTFDPKAYWEHNYRELRPDDRQIIQTVSRAFSDLLIPRGATGLTGVDVGSGANLYPTLSMLPWCDTVVLTDRAWSNCEWLRNECQHPHDEWREFWKELSLVDGYQEDFPAAELAGRTQIRQGNVLSLPKREYGIGTMFFVAESMTNYENEFEEATHHFLGALEPGAPFAAAFMDSSVGYVVGCKSFPAVQEVTNARVEQAMVGSCDQLRVIDIEVPAKNPLRDGYEGMIIAVGTVKA